MSEFIPDVDDVDETQAPVTFAQLGVPGPLIRVLSRDGKRTAFPIQEDTLPDSLAGRDILGRGRTGSGKTLAFAIPLVARLGQASHAKHRRGSMPTPRGMVLAPTRELANQINDVIEPLAQAYGMRTTAIYGGVRYNKQIRELNAGADIIVACPGRLEDLLEQHALTLDHVEIAVLDEADEMADMGFLPPIKRLLGQISFDAQHMLFSATLDHGVDAVVDEFLEDPKVHSVDEQTLSEDLMTHHVFRTTKNDKAELVRTLASGEGRRILFTRTKFQAEKLAKHLTQRGIPAAQLHGNLSQNQRDRNLQAFESGSVNVLVATDVAARGIDISGVDLVVQVDPPQDPKSFLHRSGRTARAGKAGDVVTIMTPDQRRYVRGLLKQAGIHVKPLEVTPTSPQVMELVGEVAPLVEGWQLPELKREPRQNRHSRGNARRNRERDRKQSERQSRRDKRRQQEVDEQQRAFAQRFLGDVHSLRDDEPAEQSHGKHESHEKKSKKSSRRDQRHTRNTEQRNAKRNASSPKKIHRKEQRIVRDERGEDAKRHERRMNAKKQQPRRHKNHVKRAPFRTK